MLAREPRSIADVADELSDFADPGTKPRYIWEAYDPYFRPLADQPIRLLEVGLYKGVSMRVLASYFTQARVVGADITLPQEDPSQFANVDLEQVDQRDAPSLKRMCERRAPEGFDVIIDDASHIGAWSQVLFQATFPHLKAGGLYFVEDWGTAFMNAWPDGASARPVQSVEVANGIPRRIVSHDFGMAGFIKSLIDEFASDEQPFEWMHVHSPLAVIKKSAGHNR